MNEYEIKKDVHVFGAMGEYIGTVDRVQGNSLRLGDCPFTEEGDCIVPLSWIDRADEFLHLDRSRLEVMDEIYSKLAVEVPALAGDAV